MTIQQWSIVGVVNDFLDTQQVQYSLLPQGDYPDFNLSTHPKKRLSIKGIDPVREVRRRVVTNTNCSNL